ncbi:hypothetical protein D3C76_426110 [compost metagenome]
MLKVLTLKPSLFIFLIFKKFSFDNIGELSFICLQFSLTSSNKFLSVPKKTSVAVTISSLIASIGGLVT